MKSSILIVLAIGFAGFGALEVAALNPAEAGFGQPDAAETISADKTSETSTYETPDMPEATCLTPALVAAFEPRQDALNTQATELDQRQAE